MIAEPPAAISTTIVSPMALITPSSEAVMRPGRAAGMTLLRTVSSLVAPRANDASRISLGTELRLSSASDVTIGTIMIPIRAEALSRFSPVIMSNLATIHGAMMTIPIKPRTTEGKKPRISMTGFSISLSVEGHTSERNTARARLMGREITEAARVTESEPMIRGSMPNSGGS